MSRALRARWIACRWLMVCAMIALLLRPAPAMGEVLTLKNGTQLEGVLGKIASLGSDPLKSEGSGEIKLKRVIVVDDELRRVFVGTHQVAVEPAPSPATGFERIKIPQRVAIAGRSIGGIGPILRVTPFDEWGRRIFSMSSAQGTIDVVQGITEITPTYTKVEALQGRDQYIWTMRIATSSIPRQTLSKILLNRLNAKNPDERLRIVRLYIQSDRIQDARAELEALIKDFPELDYLNEQVTTLNQLGSQRLLKEIQFRRDAGQHQLAFAMLEKFPPDGVAGETLIKVSEMLSQYEEVRTRGEQVIKLLGQHQSELKDEKLKAELTPILAEIAAEVNIHTLDRLSDYVRLSDDEKLPAEQKLSIAISGWLLGTGSGLDNIAVSRSLVVVRDVARKYLVAATKPDRDALLAQLRSQEGATPGNLAKILANMKPQVETPIYPPQPDQPPGAEPAAPPPAPAPNALLKMPAAAAGEKVAPAAFGEDLLRGAAPQAPVNRQVADEQQLEGAEQPSTVEYGNAPGLLQVRVPGLSEDPEIIYYVQLPPEYDPYKKYPVVVTLSGAGTTPIQQIDWWCGNYSPEANTRYGQATRHGYIVIAPRWTREHQRKYEFSAREHAAVLYSLRDACKRFSVDTDRVFLTGHSMGGDAAWDVALAHPDLWAGVLPVVAMSDKYVPRYWENGSQLPMYFVCGEKDGNKMAENAGDWDRYLTRTGWDVTIVQYQGRGHEHFHDEIQKMCDWMALHKRNFFPKEVEVVTMRPWDNFFWWLELDRMPPASMVVPVQWPPPRTSQVARTKANLTATNGVMVSSAAQKVTIWLSPEMVDFSAKISITVNGRRQAAPQPAIDVILEDARTRADRLHPFWAKVEN
ncbi:peptidase-like protein [Pirellula staleyi DSM 6068]|uniref:Peptidase-like protein n=1 Tax=Pirellula staleyi (strain ATCC 27377 / DSM 6068 / ICPB 4128) TaxID=530564 RepID=D2R9F3_PIRSD|nr:dienelactone hydrolase family protein [Pirellula staleyi]ADB17703.1 peptidase-like protein [Pirellula staleyi DSM 6068]